MILVAKRKIKPTATQGELDTIETTIQNTVESSVDRRNLGFFDYRLRIPVGENKFDA